MRDFAWPSVKLLEPATGAPGLGGVLGVLTAGVLASRLAGCAMAVLVIIAALRPSPDKCAFYLFLCRCRRSPNSFDREMFQMRKRFIPKDYAKREGLQKRACLVD